MMPRIATFMITVLCLTPALVTAQGPQCNNIPFPGATTACNTAVDAVRAFYPLAGMIVSGGNPVLGTARTLGGLGHVALTARVNAIKAALPDPTAANQSPVPSSFNGAVPAPMVEGALGLVKGLGGGLLSVDVLGSALILPTGIQNLTVDSNATHISDAAQGFGYGARVGVLNGSFPIPSVSVSWMHRTVPRLRYGTLGTAPGTGDDFEFTMDLKSDSYRAVAGWVVVLVDVAAGIGSDRPRSGRPWNAPSTSLAGVGGALLQTPWSVPSSSRATSWWPRATTRSMAGRMPKSSPSRPRASGRAAPPSS